MPYIGTYFRFANAGTKEKKAFACRIYSYFTQQCIAYLWSVMYCFLGFRSSTANGFGHDFLDQKFQNNLIKTRIPKTIWDSIKIDNAMSSNLNKNLKTDFWDTQVVFTFYVALNGYTMVRNWQNLSKNYNSFFCPIRLTYKLIKKRSWFLSCK